MPKKSILESITFHHLRIPLHAHVYRASPKNTFTRGDLELIVSRVRSSSGTGPVTKVRRHDRALQAFIVRKHSAPPPFLKPTTLLQTWYSLVVLVATGPHLLVYVTGTSWSEKFVDRLAVRLEHAKVESLLTDPQFDFQRIALQSLSVLQETIRERSYEATSIQNKLPPGATARQFVRNVRGHAQGRQFAANPNTALITAESGDRTLAGFLAWAKSVSALATAAQPSDFLDRFARPIRQLPGGVEPNAVLLNLQGLREQLISNTAWLARTRKGTTLLLPAEEAARSCDLFSDLATLSSAAPGKWNVVFPRVVTPGQLHKTKAGFSLRHRDWKGLSVQLATGESQTFIERLREDGALSVSMSDPSFAFARRTLFQDNGLKSTLAQLSRVILPHSSLQTCKSERGPQKFPKNRLTFPGDWMFSAIEKNVSVSDEWLVCDDGMEWADFIGLSEKARTVTFYHAKHGSRSSLSASNFQEVTAQAIKNLGWLTSPDEIAGKEQRWNGAWQTTKIRRLRRPSGKLGTDFGSQLRQLLMAPDVQKRVVLVVTFLAKSDFDSLVTRAGSVPLEPNESQLALLLSAFVNECREAGIVPGIVCVP